MRLAITVWHKSRFTNRDYSNYIEKGIEYAELSLDYPWPYWEVESFNREVHKAKENGLRIGVHLPWRDIQLASPFPEVRNGSIEYLKKLLDTLSRIEAEYAILHVSTRESIKDKHKKVIIKDIQQEILTLSEHYKNHEIGLAIENLPTGPSSTKDFLTPLLKETKTTLCYDIAHLITRIILTRKNITREEVKDKINEWAKTLEQYITNIHIHGVIKINSTIIEHFLLNDYYDLYIPVLKQVYSKKQEVITTLEIFYRDTEKKPVTPTILAKNIEELTKHYY